MIDNRTITLIPTICSSFFFREGNRVLMILYLYYYMIIFIAQRKQDEIKIRIRITYYFAYVERTVDS
jgi:hypothetical protein